MKKKLFTIAISIVLLMNFSCKKDKDETETTTESIKIGVMFPTTLSGWEAASLSYVKGVQLAIEEINASGGILGKKYELVFANNSGDLTATKTAAQYLVDKGCKVIIGPTTSGTSRHAAEQVTIKSGVLLISPSATSPSLSTLADSNLFYRTAPSDAFQGKVTAKYLKETLQKSRVGIIYVIDGYGDMLAGEFKTEFTRLGGTVVNDISYAEQTSYENYDFTSKVNSLLANNIDAVYIISQTSDGMKIVNTISANASASTISGLTFVGSDAFNNSNILPPQTSETVMNNMYIVLPSAAEGDPNNTAFKANYKARFNEDAAVYTPNCYDAMYLVAYAMHKAKSANPADFKSHMMSVSVGGEIINVKKWSDGIAKINSGIDIDYQGASGKVDFDVNGDVTSGWYQIVKIVNKQFVSHQFIQFP